MPDEWLISRICDEFNCVPSQAVRELNEGDADLLFTILEMRAYARAKEHVDNAGDMRDVKMTPTIARVFEIEAEALRLERG